MQLKEGKDTREMKFVGNPLFLEATAADLRGSLAAVGEKTKVCGSGHAVAVGVWGVDMPWQLGFGAQGSKS